MPTTNINGFYIIHLNVNVKTSTCITNPPNPVGVIVELYTLHCVEMPQHSALQGSHQPLWETAKM